jgi:hypothetical protein
VQDQVAPESAGGPTSYGFPVAGATLDPTDRIPEPDWKVLRELKSVALERLSRQILDEVEALAAQEGKSYHERYREVHEIVAERTKEMAFAFDGITRSKAREKLYAMRVLNLVTDEEFLRFSAETREIVNKLIEILQA